MFLQIITQKKFFKPTGYLYHPLHAIDRSLTTSKIAAHYSVEFVDIVADDSLEKIKLKVFHSEIINDHDKRNIEVSNYRDIPVVSNVTQQQMLDNYYQVKMDIKRLIGEEVERLKREKV